MPRVDLLTVACSVTFDRGWPNRMVRRIDGVRVQYLGLADLIQSKQTGRASDVADIEVLSAQGDGTTFRIRLPLEPRT